MARIPSRPARGFTLVELTVVVALIAIATTLGVRILAAQLEASAISSTRAKQQVIREALVNYYAKFRRLPCPDTATGVGPGPFGFNVNGPPDGRENRQGTIVVGADTLADPTQPCPAPSISASGLVAVGVLPYGDLGLAREAGLDAWGNHFNYVITVGPGPSAAWHLTGAPSDTSIGAIRVRGDRTPGGAEQEITNPTNRAVVAILSRGPNGLGAVSSQGVPQTLPAGDELINNNPEVPIPGDNIHTVYARPPTDAATAAGPAIDDIVAYLTGSDLVGPTVRSGALQSGDAEARQLVNQARNAYIGYMTNSVLAATKPGATYCATNACHCNLPQLNLVYTLGAGNPLGIGVDPWGQPLQVDQSTFQLNVTTPPAGHDMRITAASIGAIGIYSYGRNSANNNGTADDIAITIPANELKGILTQTLPTAFPLCN